MILQVHHLKNDEVVLPIIYHYLIIKWQSFIHKNALSQPRMECPDNISNSENV